jgi:hypothetical protein
MRALTLTQPWASLMALQAKRIETRSWKTPYRGELVIHAAKGFPGDAKDFCTSSGVRAVTGNMTPAQFPLSRGLCVVRLIDCISTDDKCLGEYFTVPNEVWFGDYSTGRYAWVTEFVRPLHDERTVKGALGLWEWPEA